jgi:undecaprenyl diphosphate synthase
MIEKGVKIRFIGRRDRLSDELIQQMDSIEAVTCNGKTITVCVALNYGGRAELTDAVKKIIAEGIRSDAITDVTISDYLYTDGIPDPDMIIRTSGEQRLSNFLIWQSAYSELFITDVLWPDFEETVFDRALEWYATRQRRFGGRP